MLSVRDVRRLALSLPLAEEHPHARHPSFLVRGEVFVTLWPASRRAVLKLSGDEQEFLRQAQPRVFKVTAAGNQGWTRIELQRVDPWLFEELLIAAWRRLVPRRVAAKWDADRIS
jgi:hypothetical protein